jgi:hypothetical protein
MIFRLFYSLMGTGLPDLAWWPEYSPTMILLMLLKIKLLPLVFVLLFDLKSLS